MRRYSFIFSFLFCLLLAGFVLISSSSVSAGTGSGNGQGQGGGKKTRTPTSTRTTAPTYTRTSLPTNTPLPTSTPTTIPSDTPTIMVPTSTHTATATPTSTVAVGQREQEIVNLVNLRRAAMGLGLFSIDSALVSAARRHSNDIGPAGLCQHTGTDNSSPWSRIADAGYTGNAMGEVVGCGFSTAQGVVDAWWNSPGHYAILTDPNANDIGCGWWFAPNGTGWQTCDTGYSSR